MDFCVYIILHNHMFLAAVKSYSQMLLSLFLPYEKISYPIFIFVYVFLLTCLYITIYLYMFLQDFIFDVLIKRYISQYSVNKRNTIIGRVDQSMKAMSAFTPQFGHFYIYLALNIITY